MSDDRAREDALGRIRAAFEASIAAKRATLDAQAPAIASAAERIVASFRAGGRLLACGNGGSAADAQHLCAELAGRYLRERPGLPAIALTANSSDVTAIGNDYGYDRVFARLVEAHGRSGDALIAISTSGSSPNVIAAVETARERDIATVALVGRGGGKLASLVDVPIVVPSDQTPRIQESHIAIVHVLCELIDEALFPESGGA
jgi:D-sedoheptulose 7-phosphate isomerase